MLQVVYITAAVMSSMVLYMMRMIGLVYNQKANSFQFFSPFRMNESIASENVNVDEEVSTNQMILM